MIEAEELGFIQDAARLANILPELEQVLSKLEALQERKVFKALDEGKLTPEAALYAWQEKQIMRRLFSRLDQKVKVGSSLAETHKTELE